MRGFSEPAAAPITVDRIFRDKSRDEAIARAEAIEQAVLSSAYPDTIIVVDVEDLPIAYISGNTLRPRVRVGGDIAKA